MRKNLYRLWVAGEIRHDLSQDERRELWRGYWKMCDIISKVRQSWPYKDQIVFSGTKFKIIPSPKPPELPSFPEVLRGLTCGAKNRKGQPCKRTDLWKSGRCKFHGGMSTGPKTTEGKRKTSENGKIPKRKREKVRNSSKVIDVFIVDTEPKS